MAPAGTTAPASDATAPASAVPGAPVADAPIDGTIPPVAGDVPPPPPYPLDPILECVEQVSQSSFIAYFGYQNPMGDSNAYSVGPNNGLTGNGLTNANVGQPTAFPLTRSRKLNNIIFAVVSRKVNVWSN